MFGHEVPTLHWDWEEELDSGPLLNDIFLGCTPRPSPHSPSVVFVEPDEQDISNGGFYPKFSSNAPRNFSTTTTNTHPNNQPESKWFDDYVNFNEDTFGSSSRSLPINTGSNFPAHSINSFGPTNEYDSNMFYSNSFSNFHQQQGSSNDHQMQDLSGPSTSGNQVSSIQFSQLNIQEPSFGVDPNAHPPIPESEYSASYSAPGSAYSSDWSSGSEHSSQSQDEILDEIHRECAEIERKSVSPPVRHRVHVKHRSNTIVKRSSTEQAASNSSTNSLAGLGNSDRKKELNRIAATKYREKKRLERDLLGTEHKRLESRNYELRTTVKDLKTEVSYLKKLLKDMESRAN